MADLGSSLLELRPIHLRPQRCWTSQVSNTCCRPIMYGLYPHQVTMSIAYHGIHCTTSDDVASQIQLAALRIAAYVLRTPHSILSTYLAVEEKQMELRDALRPVISCPGREETSTAHSQAHGPSHDAVLSVSSSPPSYSITTNRRC